MKAKLIKTRDDGFLTYVLKGEDKRTIAMTRYPFPSESIYLAESHGIKLQKLSPENCDEIFGVVDVWSAGLVSELDKLPYTKHLDDGQYNDGKVAGFEMGAEWGFNKAMELNKDKIFTLEDIKRAIQFGQGMELWKEEEQINKFIQSIQQPTEIDVEIVMKPYTEVSDGWILEKKEEPKLDSEGCLILKKI